MRLSPDFPFAYFWEMPKVGRLPGDGGQNLNIRYLKLKKDIFPIKNFSTKLSLFIKLSPPPTPSPEGASDRSRAAAPTPAFVPEAFHNDSEC